MGTEMTTALPLICTAWRKNRAVACRKNLFVKLPGVTEKFSGWQIAGGLPGAEEKLSD